MMQPAAVELGISLTVLGSSLDSSAAQSVQKTVLGDYTNLDDLRRAVSGADAMTFDHEHVPNEHAEVLLGEGVIVEPRPHALIYAQDKLAQRRKLAALGVPVPEFAAIENTANIEDFWSRVDGNVCLKAARGGYDGHGVWFPASLAQARELVEKLLADAVPLVAERKVGFIRELSVLVARNRSGEIRAWEVTESVQRDGICVEAVAPAPNLPVQKSEELQELGAKIARELDVTGVMAVELFQLADGSVFVNELAIRPHNTGHWTQNGSVTSQFEQHLRAVLDLPLGCTDMCGGYTVMANILGGPEIPAQGMKERMSAVWERFPQAKIHLYGKEYRPGRKLGHVNVTSAQEDEARRVAKAAAHYMVHGAWASA